MLTKWVKVGLSNALGVTSDQRATITTELAGTGAADQFVWVGKDASENYAKTVLAPFNPQVTALIAGNLTLTSLTVNTGVRIGRSGGAPTITALAGSGSTSTITSFLGAEDHGELTLNSIGTGQAAGAVVRITRATSVANTLFDLVLVARNANAALAHMYVGTRNTGFAEINFATAPVAGQTYGISYWWVN